MLAAYPRPPIDRARELAAYIDLCLAERRGSFPAPRVVRWLEFEPGMGRARWPVLPIDSPADLAERLELAASRLAWLADARGLERSAGDARLGNYRYRWQHRPHARRG